MKTIKIDGLQLVHKYLVLIGSVNNSLQPLVVTKDGVTQANPWLNNFLPVGTDLSNGGDWYLNGDNTFELPDAVYTIVVQSANFSVIRFSVNQGIINYDHSLNAIICGRGSDTLTLKGVNITIDARYIIGSGVMLSSVWDNFRTIVKGNFLPNLPQHKYVFIVGSGLIADFQFNISIDGRVMFDMACYNKYVSGNDTNYLVLGGYPLLIDARKAPSSSFEIFGTEGNTMIDNHNPSSVSKVVVGNFMPLPLNIKNYLYGLKLDKNGYLTGFHIDSNGLISLDKGFHYDVYNGIPRITFCP